MRRSVLFCLVVLLAATAAVSVADRTVVSEMRP
ncbi:MAG: hypothetical protein J07HN6_00981, partial [Halonotius sp. J07HN6]